jgi:hypothetical protein
MAEPDVSKLKAPFPYFGGKRTVAHDVWARLGSVKQYIEPFCGSAAVLLAAPQRASLEVIGDANMYVANFWRAVKCQPEAVWRESDYPVSHVDLYARHGWLTQPERRRAMSEALADPEWPGDARIAGWWVWGQCCWIGSGWCEREARGQRGEGAAVRGEMGQIPHASDAGMGLQSEGLGKIPHASDAGRGLSAHRTGARAWIERLSERLERVRVVHGSWDRCLNHHYGDDSTAVFLDPPYLAFERLYSDEGAEPVARAVEVWARENARLRIALCGHDGDYYLPGWECFAWERAGNTYGGAGTKDAERIWFSPACERVRRPAQASLFGATS